ncbi:hypothetical protein RB195_012715 [Necator americanus]|uniref:Uncharacterized protein n=1 Tax=Necator americanus TaxID=51031 RepID=A0ABR1DTQ2_NECAM
MTKLLEPAEVFLSSQTGLAPIYRPRRDERLGLDQGGFEPSTEIEAQDTVDMATIHTVYENPYANTECMSHIPKTVGTGSQLDVSWSKQI